MADNQTTFSNYDRRFYEAQGSGSHESAAIMVPEILRLTSAKSVVDVGCGTGTWLKAFRDNGVDDLVGVDGPHVDRSSLRFSADHFVVHDLRTALRMDRTFDLAISLEVGEHLPESAAQAFVTSLVGLAPVVVFGAAIPFQGGTGHVNERWPDYWRDLFEQFGYQPVDVLRKRFWREDRIVPCYVQNTIIYAADPRALVAHLNEASSDALFRGSLVHPSIYLSHLDPARVSFRKALGFAARVAGVALRRRLGVTRVP